MTTGLIASSASRTVSSLSLDTRRDVSSSSSRHSAFASCRSRVVVAEQPCVSRIAQTASLVPAQHLAGELEDESDELRVGARRFHCAIFGTFEKNL